MSGSKNDIISGRAPEPVGAFPHAKRVGDFLFLSGIGPRKRGSKEIADGIEAQTLAVFQNVRLVLEDAGASWDDIVDVTVFLTDMKADFPTFNRLYAKHFATNRPTRTTIEVGALPTPIAVELKVIAYVKP
jgi:2-aminomuconate deaminase